MPINFRAMAMRAESLRSMTNRSLMLNAAGFEERNTPCFEIQNADEETARVYVYDVIGGWYLDSAEFVKAVHAITAPNILMHFNSPGGFVFDAVAMYEAVRDHPATVMSSIDGLAASAASFLSQAADPHDAATGRGGVRIAKGGRTMIHDAMGIGVGNAGDLREYADILDALSEDISGFYADRAGGTSGTWRDRMLANNRAGTWYSAAQSVSVNLADYISGDEPKEDDPEPAPAEDRASQLIRARARVALRGVLQ